MRYLIHLLPTEDEQRFLEELRARIASKIGHNKALDYPTAHVTLISDIEDQPGDAEPIERSGIVEALERWRGKGSIALTVMPLTIWWSGDKRHVVFPLIDPADLQTLRGTLLTDIKAVVAGPGGRYTARAAKVQAQSSPHLTLAQDVDDASANNAVRLVSSEVKGLSSLRGVEVVLLQKEPRAKYQIVHRVSLGT